MYETGNIALTEMKSFKISVTVIPYSQLSTLHSAPDVIALAPRECVNPFGDDTQQEVDAN